MMLSKSLLVVLCAAAYLSVFLYLTISLQPAKSHSATSDNDARLFKTGELTFNKLFNSFPNFKIERNVQLLNVTDSNVSGSINRNKLFPCDDFTPRRYYEQRGDFWVLYNYFMATKTFRCDESITYTTHADWTFLDNLFPLIERWRGPLSIALHAPGTDFDESLKRIQYLRECSPSASLIKEFVTFHLYFHRHHMPKKELPSDPEQLPVNCSALTGDQVKFGEGLKTYKKNMELLYPINVGRNIAREMSATHYIFPSDIELYPSPNLIPNFLEMIRLNGTELQRPSPKVFVLPHFELLENVPALPKDKVELVLMLKNKTAIPFHQRICSWCHRIPKLEEWKKAPVRNSIGIFDITKREKQWWEPFFILTKLAPMNDERLTWEGKRNKMVQGYTLCLLDYEYFILDNAFLVHRPGIKRPGKGPRSKAAMAAYTNQLSLIGKVIVPELKIIYGTKAGCRVEYTDPSTKCNANSRTTIRKTLIPNASLSSRSLTLNLKSNNISLAEIKSKNPIDRYYPISAEKNDLTFGVPPASDITRN